MADGSASAPRRPNVAGLAALAALIGAAVLVALLMLGEGSGYRVTAVFESGGQLVEGNQVRVGGRAVGTVERIELNAAAQAEVRLSVDDTIAPLHQGTRATIRTTSLSGTANRYVALEPGRNDAAQVDDGGVIGADDTSAPVDLDQLLDSFDAGTRRGLRTLIRGEASRYSGRAREAARSLRYLSPALSSSSRLTRELVLDGELFERFLTDGSRAVGALAARRDELARLVRNTTTTATAIGDERASLSRALDRLPGTLRTANTTFVNLRAALDDLDLLVAESKPATRELAPFLARLRPLLAGARPTIRDLRTLLSAPGRDDDLTELTARLPRLASLSASTFPRAIRTFDRSQEVVDTLRAYTPDLAGFLTKFGQVASNYDANGHFARIQPIYSSFSYDESTGELSRIPDSQRLDGFQLDQSERCPGGATQPPPDGSAPLAVAGCSPTTALEP